MSRVAMCPRCPDAVLVSTLAFRKAEFYCLECGFSFGWLDPRPADETPELLIRCDLARDAFKALADGLIGDGGYRPDCASCDEHKTYHLDHATEEELTAHQAAIERLEARIIR